MQISVWHAGGLQLELALVSRPVHWKKLSSGIGPCGSRKTTAKFDLFVGFRSLEASVLSDVAGTHATGSH